MAIADGVSGFLEFNYSNTDSKTVDATGLSTKTKTDGFLQRYSLTVEKTIYPHLMLRAGGLFEKSLSEIESDDTDIRSTLTKLSPFIDLTLRNPSYTAGVGYNKREEKSETRGISSVTKIRESYNTILGWRPEGLPSLDVLFVRTNNFDKEHSFQDNITNNISVGSRYSPIKNLDLLYQFSYADTNDRLKDLGVESIRHSGRVNYSRQFFAERVSLYTTYNFFRQETETSRPGTGEVQFQLFPFYGLSSIDDTPIEGAMDSNAALIDGNLVARNGINIGRDPATQGDTRERNIGVDFFNETEVDTIFVWVDRGLPGTVANSFSWEVYISSDNMNWDLWQTISPASFATFDNRFELQFPDAKTRYIKVVTKPLSPAVVVPPSEEVDVSNIFVTEIQALNRRPAEEVRGKTTNTSHIYDLNIRSRLLDTPSLLYDFYYWYTRTDPSSTSRYTLSNGLTISHRLSKIFSGTARVAREDAEEVKGYRISYVYSASVTAVPLRTLNHSLVFSGRTEEIGGSHSDTNSIFLNNYAEIYKGVNITLSGGFSVSTSENDEKTENTIVNSGATLIPHATLTLNLNYSDTRTEKSGGGKEEFSTHIRRGDISVAFNPFRTVYIFTSIGTVAEKGKKTSIIQNYAASWSPFLGTALQFSFAYSETLRSEDDRSEKTIVPSLRWNIARRTYLDVSYLIIESESVSQASESKTFVLNLRISF